jgi:predicted neuraminidase
VIRFLLPFFAVLVSAQEKPFLTAEFLFPPEKWHNHSSCVVELPNGDLFTVWFHGSGERQADDVVIEGARLKKGARQWSPRFLLADHPGFPDTNPTAFLDSKQRLWLLWPVILANLWETALMNYKISSNYLGDGPPEWDVETHMLVLPPKTFEAKVQEAVARMPPAPEANERAEAWRARILKQAGDKYFSRMGWMTRAHPLELPNGRILVPLYSDGFSFSLIAITDDGGKTWLFSEPLVGGGNIQPSLVRKKDGAIVAFMRDNGPPPKRVLVSESKDNGMTWSPVRDSDIPNPGTGMETIVLKDGTWAMILNDIERGRHSLAVWLSDDEGATWKWKRHLEYDGREKGAGSFHYPSLIQARDGTLHATYSYFLNHLPEGEPRKAIKHAHFNTAWVKEGDPK